ncbi:hypothetical protein OIU76_030257 [Salix suchowensis]|nr:hypothetical protein OIU76_030257 [Salix suchowensis]
MSPEPRRREKRRSEREREFLLVDLEEKDVWVEGAGVSVAEEDPELVLRWSVVVVVAVDVKLMLWRSSAKSSSHGGGSIVERER